MFTPKPPKPLPSLTALVAFTAFPIPKAASTQYFRHLNSLAVSAQRSLLARAAPCHTAENITSHNRAGTNSPDLAFSTGLGWCQAGELTAGMHREGFPPKTSSSVSAEGLPQAHVREEDGKHLCFCAGLEPLPAASKERKQQANRERESELSFPWAENSVAQ